MLKAEEIIFPGKSSPVGYSSNVSCENMHTGDIIETEQAVFRNTMYMYKYMCVYMHIITIVKEDVMNMKQSKGVDGRV